VDGRLGGAGVLEGVGDAAVVVPAFREAEAPAAVTETSPDCGASTSVPPAALIGAIVGETTGILVAIDGASVSQCCMAGAGAFAGSLALILGVLHAPSCCDDWGTGFPVRVPGDWGTCPEWSRGEAASRHAC
jgi:hypothetical protein